MRYSLSNQEKFDNLKVLQELEYDLYDYECHDYDTDATTTWLATTSAEMEGDTSFSFARQEPSLPFKDEEDVNLHLEEEHSFLLDSRRKCEDENPTEPLLLKDRERIEEKIPPVACLDDLELWDG